MNPLDKTEIGSTGVEVTRLGVGGAPFGSMPVEEAEARSIESIRKGLGDSVLRTSTLRRCMARGGASGTTHRGCRAWIAIRMCCLRRSGAC